MKTDFTPEQQALISEIEKNLLPRELHGLLEEREGSRLFLENFPHAFSPEAVANKSIEQTAWEQVGVFYLRLGRFHEAVPIFSALYDHMLLAQAQTGKRCHKGMPVVWMSDCYSGLGCPWISMRFLMLALIEDAISTGGEAPSHMGVYFRAVWRAGLPDSDVKRYAGEAHKWSEAHSEDALYPERVLVELDQNWVRTPSSTEIGMFPANTRQIQHLLGRLGDGSGGLLELLAHCLLSAMPGCRTSRRQRSGTHEYDLVCSFEGAELDFRSELGRYFLCECKDWSTPADVRTMAILCRVLDSVKSRFGILFSRSGISGEGHGRHAELEQIKIFQDRGTVIVVIDQEDLESLGRGANFVSLLREKYERVRLNLTGA